jgi:putative sterol carrier protein
MTHDPITSLSSIRRELEAGWKLFDDAFLPFDSAQWEKKFGRTWTYADQPWHLAYFDRTMAKYLRFGAGIPDGEQLHLRSMGEVNKWNERELASRSPTHSVQDSLAAMRNSRDEVRSFLANATETDLDGRCWMPLIFGWATARDTLQAIIVHNVAEYWKLWLRTGKRGPAPSEAAIHLRLGFMMGFLPMTLNKELAAKKSFTLTWNFDGPGGGAWTFRVADGKCVVSESPASDADLTITMKPENFHKLITKMTPPPLMMLTGEMKVKGLRAMGTFAKMFPEPKPGTMLSTGVGMPTA